MAKSWKIAPDWSYIDFDIKPGIKFHNGDPLTAEDVKFSFETHMRPELKQVLGVAYHSRIKNIEVLGPYKVRFQSEHACPGFMETPLVERCDHAQEIPGKGRGCRFCR